VINLTLAVGWGYSETNHLDDLKLLDDSSTSFRFSKRNLLSAATQGQAERLTRGQLFQPNWQ